MATDTALAADAIQPDPARPATGARLRSWWSLRLILVLLFAQVWRDVGGLTIRLDDVVSLAMIGWWLLSSLRGLKFRYFRSHLNPPLLFWMGVIALGVVVTLVGSFSVVVKQDGAVNGFRLLLALGLFFVVANHPLPAARKIEHIFSTTIGFSFITSFVALLQIAYWSGAPLPLPAILTTVQEGANTQLGREIFALFIGNTGTHTWSAMLALQALAVWIVANSRRQWPLRAAGLAYFLVLVFILIRTSVRTSILGLGVALFALLLIQTRRSHYSFNRFARPLLLVGGVLVGVAAVLLLAPQSYYLERISQAIPQWGESGLVIDRASNIYGRVDYAANALRIYRVYPLLGGGFESYESLSGTIGTYTMIHAHNSYLQTLAELGTAGAVALLWLGWAVFRTLRAGPPRVGAAPAKLRLWYLTVAAFIFLAFSAIFANPFWEPNQVAYRMILLGALVHVQRESWA